MVATFATMKLLTSQAHNLNRFLEEQGWDKYDIMKHYMWYKEKKEAEKSDAEDDSDKGTGMEKEITIDCHTLDTDNPIISLKVLLSDPIVVLFALLSVLTSYPRHTFKVFFKGKELVESSLVALSDLLPYGIGGGDDIYLVQLVSWKSFL